MSRYWDSFIIKQILSNYNTTILNLVHTNGGDKFNLSVT